MKLTNWQVYNFVNIVNQSPDSRMPAKSIFAIAMTKAALEPTLKSIVQARESIIARMPKPSDNGEYTDEQREETARLNDEWTGILNTQVSIPHVPGLSIDALSEFLLTPAEGEFILHLPFIKENVLEDVEANGGDNDADK